MGTVTASDGTELAVRTWGDPAVVLVHGLGLSSRSFGEVPERVAGQPRVVAYDLRGHGDSVTAAGGDCPLEAHAEDLVAVLRETVPQGGGAVVVGNSLDGGIILAAARGWNPSRVSGIVFAGSGGSGVAVPGLPARGVPDALSALVMKGWLQVLRLTSLAAKDVRHVRPLADRLVRRAAFHSDSPDAAVTRVREDFSVSIDGITYVGCCSACGARRDPLDRRAAGCRRHRRRHRRPARGADDGAHPHAPRVADVLRGRRRHPRGATAPAGDDPQPGQRLPAARGLRRRREVVPGRARRGVPVQRHARPRRVRRPRDARVPAGRARAAPAVDVREARTTGA